MWRHLRSSPSMAVAVVSLVVALLCVLYVMERPGTIAIGSPNPYGEIRVIDADSYTNMYNGPSDRRGCRAYEQGWDHVKVTVPEGKVWMVIATPSPWNPSWGSVSSPDVMSIGYYFEYTSSYSGRRVHDTHLTAGTYDDVDLYIFSCRYNKSIGWWNSSAIYLVVEVDEYYEVGE